jgi:hypothetical protein
MIHDFLQSFGWKFMISWFFIPDYKKFLDIF